MSRALVVVLCFLVVSCASANDAGPNVLQPPTTAINNPDSPEQNPREGSYSWQICTDTAMLETEGVTSGFWATSVYGVGDPTNAVFVTEVADILVGNPRLFGFRTDPTGQSTIAIEVDRSTDDYSTGWQPFINQYAEHLAIGGLDERNQIFYSEMAKLYAAHHVDGLRTLDGVVGSFLLDEVQSIALVDQTGANYIRFEQPAVEDQPVHSHAVDWGAQQLGFYNAVRSSAWVLDVWADETGSVERIRLQTQEFRRHWAELRFVEDVQVEELPGPGASERLGFKATCPENDDEVAAQGWMGFEPWDAAVTTPVIATLDPSGRPYDAEDDGGTIAREALGTLIATDRSVLVSDAFVLGSDSTFPVEFDGAPQGDVDLDATVLATRFPDYDGRQIHGIRLDVPDSTVDIWTSFETAYCTDGGTGRISSRRSLEQSDDIDEAFNHDAWIGDLDDRAGNDTIVFFNGFGDGCFPMSRGRDSDGATVALVVWNPMYPWRLMIPDGTPPPDITEREIQIQDCLDGTRTVQQGGFCSSADN